MIKQLDLHIGRARLSVRVAWALIEEVPLLLGRMDVFEKFRITFDERRGVVDFTGPGPKRSKRRT